MASSYYTNTLHVNFASVLAMDDQGMVSMFQALMASGLEGFLGCPAVIYEASLVDFFANASVRDGMVVSIVHGVTVEFSEQFFAETFELPVEVLIDLTEIPKDLVFDARSIVSFSGEPVSMFGKKKEMKFEYRLLCDIMEKTISVKAGSFDSLTMEKFLMLTAIICEVKINWNRVLFNILKDMVTAGSRQAKGYAIQNSLLLENIPNLELGESSEFSSSKILTDKTVHRYIVLNEKVGAEVVAAAPQVKKAPKKHAASKKRPAVATVGEPVLKKKRTMKKKSVSSKENLEIVVVAQEAVPIQIIEPIPAAPVVEPSVEEQREATSAVPIDEDISAVERPADVETIVEEFDEPVVEGTAEEIRPPSTDDVDNIIEQVLAETALFEADEEDHGVGTSDVGDQTAGTTDDSVPWYNLPYEVLIARDSERVFEMASDTDNEEMEIIDVGDQQLQTVDAAVSRADAAADYFVEEPVEETETEADELSADEAKSIEDILMTIPVEVPLPSAGVEITKITLGKDIKIPGVDERTWYLDSLPKIKLEEKGKKPLHEKDPVKGNPMEEQVLLILADIECLVQLRENIIDNVDRLFNSFSFKKLSSLKVEDISAKEELVLSWEKQSRQELSQFCTVFVQNSLFNGLSITDIRSFVSSIVFERTALRDVQRSSVLVASQDVQLAFSSVFENEDDQMDIDQRLTSPTTTADSSMNFSDNEILLGDDATPNQPLLPTVATNLSAYLDDFRTLLWQRRDAQSEDIRHIGDSHNDVLSRLTTLDKSLRDALLQQGEDLRKLIQTFDKMAALSLMSRPFVLMSLEKLAVF
ncbi:hypothetical protein F511_25800 [Dorcoceras hygrometricum]|uniref:Dystroglycan-like n=1 Tax=Dorcoceras hygrometricum TaxID=472368 RepID=A0A2Z7C3Z9_9LAMI|nr:hypothetical protein F511_25800 [Dorcoceras hygrometricum]